MRGANSHTDFIPRNSYQELQLDQTIIFLSEFCHTLNHSILDKRVSTIFKKMFGFNSICLLLFFQKYAMTSVHKNPKISRLTYNLSSF